MKKKQDVIYGGISRDGKTIVSGDFRYVAVHGIDDPKPLNRRSKRAIVLEYRKLAKESSAELLEQESKKAKAAKERRKKIKATGYLRRRANNKRK